MGYGEYRPGVPSAQVEQEIKSIPEWVRKRWMMEKLWGESTNHMEEEKSNPRAQFEGFKKSLEQELARRTGRTDIEVTMGPYRGHDVSVSEAPDHHPIVDFYIAMSWDANRVAQAVNYAVDLIKNWEFVRAEAEAEKKVMRPVFERIQTQFPEAELAYVTREAETHFVAAERREALKPLVRFDLWFGMTEDNIERLKEDLIPETLRKLEEKPRPVMFGIDYW